MFLDDDLPVRCYYQLPDLSNPHHKHQVFKSYGLKLPPHFNTCIISIFVLERQKSKRISISKTHKLKNIEEIVLSNIQNTAIVESV